MAFDFRNHGKSDSCHRGQPTPWVTTSDLDDAGAALDYLRSRNDVDPNAVSVFGLGKGATIALCLAGLDSTVKSVVLDTPQPENRLFERNCWQTLIKSTKLPRRRISKFSVRLFRAVLYSLSCPFVSAGLAWQRFILGLWYDCRFVNSKSLAMKVRQPIMIVHGYADSAARPDQIRAFCDQMPVRPKLWFASTKDRSFRQTVSEDCCDQVAKFLAETP